MIRVQRVTSILFALTLFVAANAQENGVLYSHYTFNGLSINPAYTGSHEMLSISVSHRSQWIGFEGAPSYNIIGIHTPFRNTRAGLGILVMNESIGLRKHTAIYANYSHRMELGPGKLALGLKGGISSGSVGPADLEFETYFAENTRYLLPNFGVGIYYYTPTFHAGLSVPLLLGYQTTETGEVAAYHDFRRYAYYLTTGLKIGIAPDWKIEPSALAAYDKTGGLLADAGLSIIYKDAFRLGGSYRTKQAVIMLFDFKVNYQLRVGIAYDYGISGLNEYNRG